MPLVTAFGEVGFDHTEAMSKWQDQVELLHRLLPFLEARHLLVVHCRGVRGDSGDCEFAIRSLLFHLKLGGVPQSQRIHFHCFTGTKSLLEIWGRQQPNTFFGFTRVAATFNKNQVAALRAVPDSKLLLESDAPYFASKKGGHSTPFTLYETAEILAGHRGVDVSHILKITTQNGTSLYKKE
ncbi:putative deoxyribonuclease TATDN2 [Lingula anatina]|uniref:Deoxyribonuclease TATDN2 n=1 Tax=Lingula anatina TaxID=7574 RepID=A0A2R2MRD7_LINAN|nr:putative deoxyribonuclease TATDN2 [Lingula anatina]|eukprot:XP_023932814.1 putative deoxyribonuclease TATDN2 [Lingula anatina]